MLLTTLIFIQVFLVGVLAWKNINWAITLVITFVPVYLIRLNFWFLPVTVLELWIGVIFLVWLLKVFREKQKITFSNYKWLAFFFLALATVAIYFSADKVAALGLWKAYFIEPFLFFIVVINSVKTKKDWQMLIKAIGLSVFVVAIPAIIQKFYPVGINNEFWAAEETRRVVSWYGFPNAIGLYLAPIAVFFWGYFIKDKQKHWDRLFALAVVSSSVAAIVFAKSEGALVGLVVGIVFVTFFSGHKNLQALTAVGVLVGIFIVLFTPALSDFAKTKVLLRDHSGQIRQQQWKETWTMLGSDKIVTGSGLSGYQAAIEPYHQEGIWLRDYDDPRWLDKVLFDETVRSQYWQPTEVYMYPHNIVLNFWTELGLFGLILFSLLTIKYFYNILRINYDENKYFYILISGSMIAILIHGLVDVPYFKNDLSLFWWLLLAMSWILVKNKKIHKTH
jgi:O-antigen ligase